ncbi:uncharacterized protein EDB91DRAFT_1248452 [Suillus paluster]|uniref:uncharacterized protein n=1 Tax=Suillus paluster TaxID=48578 RepID=UPI001B87E47D|nr:uncharacterized protein EDB91DRAFT_1248452 [Suillus paluster]KAG1740125.1 hypothetical protein EDB91DRAFT_1248452 [Suillus paluster]
MPAVTTRSGCHIRRPPLPDQRKTHRKAADICKESNVDNSFKPPKWSCPGPHRRAGPKNVIGHGDNHPELSIHPPPKPHPLARSKCSGPMTSSAEEEIFETNEEYLLTSKKLLHPSLENTATAASKNPNAISQSQTNDLNGSNDNDQETSATCTESHDAGYSNKDHGNDTSGTSTESHYPEDGGNDDGHKTSATSTNGRPRRSGGIKSYAPDRSAGEESSPSNNNEDSSEDNPPSPPRLMAKQKQKLKVTVEVDEHHGSEDEDDEDFVKTKGRMPQVGILKAQELGKKTLEAARTLGQEYGKSVQTILIEAGLTMKATRKESLWNQHQTWFAATHPLPKGVSGVVSPEDIKAWKDDPQHASLWKEIQENWDCLMMGVCDAFTKSAAYWHRTHGIHIAGVAIFPGDEEAGHQASGLFAGSDMVKALINSHQLDIKCWLDELTTILKYKDLEAAHAEGKTFSFLPASSTAPNGSLLCNGKPARDRNRKVAPMMISEKFAEAGHPLKTSNSRWLTMLDILYTEKLCIHDWPTGVPPPGPDFDLKALSASHLHALVAPYLRLHLGAMYKAELGLDDDSEAEAAKAKKRKGKSKKLGDKGRKKGAMVEEPSVVLHISRWPESDILTVETQATSMCLIPLIINTNGKVVRSLQDSEKFIKDLPQDDTQDDTPRCHTKQVIKKPAVSDLTALRSTMGASHSNQEALCSNQEASCSTMGASRPNQEASHSTMGALHSNQEASCSTMGALRSNQEASCSNQEVSRSNQEALCSNHEALCSRHHTNRAIYDNFPPSSPPQEAPHSRHPTNRVFEELPPSLPPTPSSQFLSPPPISRVSTPMSTSGYSHVRDVTYPSRSQYERSHNGPRRYQHAFDNAMPTYNPDTRKWTWPHYESAWETEDLEHETVEERHRVRVHENSRIPLGHAQSQAHVSSAPIASTSRSQLPSHSSVVPTSCTGSSQRRNHSTVRPSSIRPASPDCRAIIEEDEYEYY